MSTATPPSAAQPARREILIVSHCTLFYWWPVWAVGFLLAIITAFTGDRVALVPNKTDHFAKATGTLTAQTVEETKSGTAVSEKTTSTKTIDITKQDVLVAPKAASEKQEGPSLLLTPVHISRYKNLGVLFTLILLLVIFITNVPLRGLWSVIVIIFLVALVIILGLLGILDELLHLFAFLDIRISTGGYVVISAALFVIWLLVFVLFDRQIYMVFTPGQFRVKLEIGDAETAYDTTGMTIQKQRSDLFRHWILGLGSGDLIVRTAGAQGHQFDMPNVLFLGRKVREIEDMLRSRQVVSAQKL
jgi:hypothetical protein